MRETRRAASSEAFKRVTANSVDLVKAKGSGPLSIHAEHDRPSNKLFNQESSSSPPDFNKLFNQERREPVHQMLGIPTGQRHGNNFMGSHNFGGNFSPLGKGRKSHEPTGKHKRKRQGQTIVINVNTHTGRRKHKRKETKEPPAWSPF